MFGLLTGLVALGSVGLAAPALAVETPDPGRTYVGDCQGDVEAKPREVVACCHNGVYIDSMAWSK